MYGPCHDNDQSLQVENKMFFECLLYRYCICIFLLHGKSYKTYHCSVHSVECHTHTKCRLVWVRFPCSVIKSLYLKSLEYMQPTKLGVIRADLVISTSIVTLERDENTLLYGRRFEHAKRITMRIVSNKHFFNIF